MGKAFIFVEENKDKLNKKEVWWISPMRIFSEISTWIAFPAILAVISGKALDNKYDTDPWLLVACVALAFLISSYGIMRAVRVYAARIKKEDNKKL